MTGWPPSREIVSAERIRAALLRLAGEIRARLAGRDPVVLTVMNGGLVFAGQLLPLLDFRLCCDYVHVRRYGAGTTGGELVWIAGPEQPVAGRHVLLLDDILDEGRTLAAIASRLAGLGAAEVLTAALVCKQRATPPVVRADFVGVTVPDEFVFGFGMDVAGAWRNLPAIRALDGDSA